MSLLLKGVTVATQEVWWKSSEELGPGKAKRCRCKTAEESPEQGNGERLGGKLQQAIGNVNEEKTGGASDDGWSAGTPLGGEWEQE